MSALHGNALAGELRKLFADETTTGSRAHRRATAQIAQPSVYVRAPSGAVRCRSCGHAAFVPTTNRGTAVNVGCLALATEQPVCHCRAPQANFQAGSGNEVRPTHQSHFEEALCACPRRPALLDREVR